MSRTPQQQTTTLECSNCGATSQLHLCPRCLTDLREWLTDLDTGTPLGNGKRSTPMFDALTDSALGHTKLGEPVRRTPRYRRHIDGDKQLATQIELLPGEHWETIEGPAQHGEPWPLKQLADTHIDLKKARHQRQRMALQHALGAAKINLTASELLNETQVELLLWARDICQARGTEPPFRAEK